MAEAWMKKASEAVHGKPPEIVQSNEHALATTERGSRLEKHTEADVDLALRLLILNGGDVNRTVALLKEETIIIDPAALRYWRDTAFSNRYFNLRTELARDVGESVAGRAMERAQQADRGVESLIERMTDKIKDIPPKDLAPSARALSQVGDNAVKNAQLLRDKPTEIKETRSVTELLETLRKMGVLQTNDSGPSFVETVQAKEIE